MCLIIALPVDWNAVVDDGLNQASFPRLFQRVDFVVMSTRGASPNHLVSQSIMERVYLTPSPPEIGRGPTVSALDSEEHSLYLSLGSVMPWDA